VIFGHVTKGLETVDKIAEAPVKVSPSGEASQPLTPVKITSIDVIEK
jgi:peptidyl-prolyl cis-trans isomerase A (cyclophilin A)